MQKKSVKKIAIAKDPVKESTFRKLSALLDAAGYKVRREKLKAGPGWKAISGSCRVVSDKLIFLDPRMAQDDQLLFLRGRAQTLGLDLSAIDAEAAKAAEVESVAKAS